MKETSAATAIVLAICHNPQTGCAYVSLQSLSLLAGELKCDDVGDQQLFSVFNVTEKEYPIRPEGMSQKNNIKTKNKNSADLKIITFTVDRYG